MRPNSDNNKVMYFLHLNCNELSQNDRLLKEKFKILTEIINVIEHLLLTCTKVIG